MQVMAGSSLLARTIALASSVLDPWHGLICVNTSHPACRARSMGEREAVLGSDLCDLREATEPL